MGVVFQHLELLADAGYDAFLTTPASGPDWYPLKVPVHSIGCLEPSHIPPADILVATSWRTIKPVMASERGIPVHFCQGYEASLRELAPCRSFIDEAYSLKIPKLTVSRHLEAFLRERFNAETFYIGQMLNREIFHPRRNPLRRLLERRRRPSSILVVGPFEGSYKNIPVILEGIRLANKRLKRPLRLVRVSQFPLSDEEERIMKPDAYLLRVPFQKMGEIYRASDIFISLSTAEEGFGLPPLEAMACGIPTILSRIPSHLDFGHPQDYALFTGSSPEAVSEAILRMYEDTAERRRLSKRGLEVAESFTREALLSRLTSAFESIASRREGGLIT